MRITVRRFLSALAALGLVCACSCVGVRSDIVLNADGTGRMSLEYRVSRQFEAVGALDGNAGRPAVPVGRADFERSIARLEGLELVSFSSREEGRDLVSRAVISFSRLEDVLPLLDYQGAALYREGENRVLRLNLGAGREDTDPRLAALLEEACRGYEIALSLSAPGGAALRVKGDREGLGIGESGKRAEFSAALSRFFRPGGDLELEFVF
jgi:hypothetical protein